MQEAIRQLDLFRNVLCNADLIGVQLIMSLLHTMSSITPYSGWWQTPRHLAECSEASIPSPHKPPWTKKGQNSVSCISDVLGFVQTAFLGMGLAYVPNHTGKWGLFFFWNYVSRNRETWLPTLCKCLGQAMKIISDGNKREKVAFELRGGSSQMI